MSAIRIMAITFFAVALAGAEIKKVTLFVNYGGGGILHPGAIQVFKNTLTTLAGEKNFDLTISEQTNTAAQKASALSNLRSMDVVLFANIGKNSFQDPGDQSLIENFFMSGGKGIGFHASIDHHKYWKWWEDLHNGSGFQGHGNSPFKLNADPEMSRIPALKRMWDEAGLGDPNISQTEVYTLNMYPRGKTGVTMMQTVAPPHNAIPVHDFTWHRKIGSGEYIFTCLGHGPNDFTGGWLQKAIWAWMEYLNGKYGPSTGVAPPGRSLMPALELRGKRLEVIATLPGELEIRDVTGKGVRREKLPGSGWIDLSLLDPGLYTIRLKTAAGYIGKRILVP